MTPSRRKRAGQRPTKQKAVRRARGAKERFADDLIEEGVGDETPTRPEQYRNKREAANEQSTKPSAHETTGHTGTGDLPPVTTPSGKPRQIPFGGVLANFSEPALVGAGSAASK